MSIKRLLFALVISLFLATAFACGEDDDDTSNNDTNGNNDETSEVCESSHVCENDVCECTTEGMEEEECTDDESCEDECEVCTEE